jgi:hypothetical protein
LPVALSSELVLRLAADVCTASVRCTVSVSGSSIDRAFQHEYGDSGEQSVHLKASLAIARKPAAQCGGDLRRVVITAVGGAPDTPHLIERVALVQKSGLLGLSRDDRALS